MTTLLPSARLWLGEKMERVHAVTKQALLMSSEQALLSPAHHGRASFIPERDSDWTFISAPAGTTSRDTFDHQDPRKLARGQALMFAGPVSRSLGCLCITEIMQAIATERIY